MTFPTCYVARPMGDKMWRRIRFKENSPGFRVVIFICPPVVAGVSEVSASRARFAGASESTDDGEARPDGANGKPPCRATASAAALKLNTKLRTSYIFPCDRELRPEDAYRWALSICRCCASNIAICSARYAARRLFCGKDMLNPFSSSIKS